MKRIPVIAVSDKVPVAPYYCYQEFHESLARFGHEATILGMDQPYRGMMDRLKRPLAHMKSIFAEVVIICDCWDMIFLESPAAMAERFRGFGKAIVFSSERTLFPAKDYGAYPAGTTDSRYLNAGFIIGEREALIALFEHLDVANQPEDSVDDDGKWTHYSEQELLHHAFVEQFVPMTLDYESALCQSMFKTKPGEIELGEQCRNTLTGSHPMALHWNGPAKTEAPILPAEGVRWWRGRG